MIKWLLCDQVATLLANTTVKLVFKWLLCWQTQVGAQVATMLASTTLKLVL